MRSIAAPDLGVSPRELQIIRQILAQHFPACTVVAFGSRVKDQHREYSDLDLALIGPAEIPLNQVGLLRSAFDESELPFTVDLVDWALTPDYFRDIIKERHAVIQEGSTDFPGC